MTEQIDMKGMAYIIMEPGATKDKDQHFLCVMGDGKFIRVEIDSRTLCRLAAESAHYLPKFIPGAYAHTPGEITDNQQNNQKE